MSFRETPPDDRLDATSEAQDAWEELESEGQARLAWELEHAAEQEQHEAELAEREERALARQHDGIRRDRARPS